MNILRILVKEFKIAARDYKANMLMILLPIILIVILGAAFSNVFEMEYSFDEAVVLYTEAGSEGEEPFIEAFKSFREQIAKDTGINFEEAESLEHGIESVSEYKYAAYIYADNDQKEIRLYKNERKAFYANLVESALNSFADTYGAMYAIAVNNPSALGEIQEEPTEEHIVISSLDSKKKPGSTDYYAVTMMTLILMYASFTGGFSVKGDIEQMTASRIIASPVRKYELLTGKVLGCLFITVLQALVVILFSKIILKANWGEDMATIAILLFTYSIMTVSLGVGTAYLFRKSEAVQGLINTIIPIMVFLGGGYVPISVMGPAFEKLKFVSPVYWNNDAIFNLIYGGNYSKVAISIAINLSVAAVFIAIAALFSGKGAGKYA